MGLTYTEFLDNLYTTTWQNRQDGVADNIFNASPFWFWLKDKGKIEPVRGGRYIEENLEYAKNSNVKWISKGGTVTLNDYEFLTVAQFTWRYLVASIVRFGVDEQQNSGKQRVMSLMNSKLNNTEKSLTDELEIRLSGGDGGATDPANPTIDGLKWLVPDDPTASQSPRFVGGIDNSQATYSWWRNQSINLTGVSFASSGVKKMRTILNNCMNNRAEDRPDIIVQDQTSYEYYEDNVLTYYRTQNTKLADLGFQNQTFKGIPMVWTPQITTRMYFLNTRYLKFVYDPAMYFDMTEWKPIPDQVNDRTAQVVTACSFLTNRRKVHGVIYNIDTP